jgi:glycerophosphoryl diester phosphodiesterase
MGNFVAYRLTLVCIAMALISANGRIGAASKISIAHRGASAYAPEHTLSAYRLAIEQGADYVEQDLAITRDGVLICLHDDSLERTTNVEDVYPDRGVVDPATGRRQWLAADFTLAEIRRLDAGSWFAPRFAGEGIPSWDQAVAAVGTAAGLYPELKTPALYRARNINMAGVFADSFRRLALDKRRPESLILQSFDDETLRELARLLPSVPRTFLIESRDGARWLSPQGLADIARFATGIGPAKALIDQRPDIVRAAHAAGLTVTPYTFTSRAPASTFPDVRDEMAHYLFTLDVDALFTDNPDRFPRDERTR